MNSSKTYGGIFFIFLAVLFFSIQDAQVKYLSNVYNIFYIIWIKSLSQFVLVYIFLRYNKKENFFYSKNYKIQIFRGVSYSAATILYFFGLKYLELSVAVSLSFVAPFLVSLFGYFLLKEKVSLRRWLTIILGFSGVLIITRPGLIEFNYAFLFVLSAAIFWALFQILSRYLKEDGAYNMLMISSLVGFLISSTYVSFFWEGIKNFNLFIILSCLGIWASLAEYFLIKAYSLAKASIIAPFFYFMMVWYTVFGYLFFAEIPDFYTLFGCFVLIIFGIINLKLSNK
jgi:S-adenosylmethionine uptake transporter|tara:strand:- start:6162 stop:7016 length:855 start_codon:yes stop_codon:yes gene_type:complete